MNREYSLKKSQIENKKKKNYDSDNVRTGSRCMVDEERLESFMMEVPITEKPVDFLYDKNLRHERVSALLLACNV